VRPEHRARSPRAPRRRPDVACERRAGGRVRLLHPRHRPTERFTGPGARLSTNPGSDGAGEHRLHEGTIVAGSDLEATLCSSATAATTGGRHPPNGVSPNGTANDARREPTSPWSSTPNNKSGPPRSRVLATSPEARRRRTSPPPDGRAVERRRRHTDDDRGNCHNTDAASRPAQGPHGSAVTFLIRNGAAKPGCATAAASGDGIRDDVLQRLPRQRERSTPATARTRPRPATGATSCSARGEDVPPDRGQQQHDAGPLRLQQYAGDPLQSELHQGRERRGLPEEQLPERGTSAARRTTRRPPRNW